MSELVEVQILGMPLDLHARSAAHNEALQREFELIRRRGASDDTVPVRLRTLVDDLRARYGGLTEAQQDEIVRARDAGEEQVSLTYRVPVSAGAAALELLASLREADDYCRSGDLMTLATPDDQVAFREWFLGEFSRQAAGRPPRPWTSVQGREAEGDAGHQPDAHGRSVPDGREPSIARPSATVTPTGVADGWQIHHDGSTAHVGFSGDLDLESAPRLRAVLAQAFQHDPAAVVLDLSEVTFLDSVGLSALLTVQLRLDADHVEVEVVPSPAVRRVFELAGVADLFGI